MSAAPFDTHAAVKRLTASGFDERQAEALVETLSARQGELTTKADIRDMATKADVQAVKTDVQTAIAALEIRLVKWMVGLVVPLYAVLIAIPPRLDHCRNARAVSTIGSRCSALCATLR